MPKPRSPSGSRTRIIATTSSLLFICCHPDLPATQQVAVALRIVSGLSVAQIARAFLVSESAMEQRITRAKRSIAEAGVRSSTGCGRAGRPGRGGGRHDLSYLQRRVLGEQRRGAAARAAVRGGDPARPASCRVCFRASPRSWGSRRCSPAACARRRALRSARPDRASGGSGPQPLEPRLIAQALALIDKAMRHDRPLPTRSRPRSRRCMPGRRGRRIPIGRRSISSTRARADAAFAGHHPQPGGRGRQGAWARRGLEMIEPLAPRLSGYFHSSG